MKTILIAGVTPATFDAEVMAALAGFDGMGSGGHAMRIGIRNEAGVIYREIVTVGLGGLMDTVGRLQRLGLVDELADETSMRENCDAIFRRP